MIDELKSELDRTGLTLRKLALHIAETDRSKFPPDLLKAMLSECALLEVTDHADDLIEILYAQSDKPMALKNRRAKRDTKRRKVITPEMRVQLNNEIKRTQVSVNGLCRLLFPEMDTAMINGSVQLVRKGVQTTLPFGIWAPLMDRLRSLPSPGATLSISAASGEMVLPESQHYPEKAEAISLMGDQVCRPDLDREKIEAARPRPNMIGYELSERFERLGYIVIGDRHYQQLHAERRRTLVSSRRLLASANDVPGGLRHHQVSQWFLGKTRCAEKRYLDWVLARYSKLPTAR